MKIKAIYEKRTAGDKDSPCDLCSFDGLRCASAPCGGIDEYLELVEIKHKKPKAKKVKKAYTGRILVSREYIEQLTMECAVATAGFITLWEKLIASDEEECTSKPDDIVWKTIRANLAALGHNVSNPGPCVTTTPLIK